MLLIFADYLLNPRLGCGFLGCGCLMDCSLLLVGLGVTVSPTCGFGVPTACFFPFSSGLCYGVLT
jgi:hypothetical protein